MQVKHASETTVFRCLEEVRAFATKNAAKYNCACKGKCHSEIIANCACKGKYHSEIIANCACKGKCHSQIIANIDPPRKYLSSVGLMIVRLKRGGDVTHAKKSCTASFTIMTLFYVVQSFKVRVAIVLGGQDLVLFLSLVSPIRRRTAR
jgi:hypothetical protein